MKTDTPTPIRLKDYQPTDYLIDTVHLDVRLATEATRIRATLEMRPNPGVAEPSSTLVLDGEQIDLKGVHINAMMLAQGEYAVTDSHLTIKQVPNEPFQLVLDTVCNPTANTALSGLYRSGGNYCTQCEAEGFRRITYYLDRPDVLAVFSTRIEAGRSEAPVLLSNGNLVESGDVDGTERHFAIWHDPHPKPSYLFALVAGDLACVEDTYTTGSGRNVVLRIFVEPGKEDRCDYAMDSLKRSMKWDEDVFGLEYDLDIFMIVAVSDFNMGAMENKGLNVFNDKYVLARPDTATDADYANIEGIIAHEYFHNWTGNRITCRDWFQLCLKEGLTVFRDQEFSSDMRSRAVKRIADVRLLRSHQFPEDAGPLAHPVRPNSYIEINNFYTATVYEKGAEIVRMMHTLLGPEAFRRAMDLYFERHDGEAATVEKFVACMEAAGSTDLGQFSLWYEQAGTPEVTVSSRYNQAQSTLDLTVTQMSAPTPGQKSKEALHVPLSIGLIDQQGQDMALIPSGDTVLKGTVLELKQREQSFRFENIGSRPVVSVNRGFTAPVRLVSQNRDGDLEFLMAHDSDLFNRWEAAQSYGADVLISMVDAVRKGDTPRKGTRLAAALGHSVRDTSLEPAFVAQIMALPGETDLARVIGQDVDPGAIHIAREHLKASLADQLKTELETVYFSNDVNEVFSPAAPAAGRRALRNTAMAYLASGTGGPALAFRHFTDASNMTDQMAALNVLAGIDSRESNEAMATFFDRWQTDHLVVDKWLSLNALGPEEKAIDRVSDLLSHPAFSMSNPNKVRALVGTLAGANLAAFNRADGAGYRLVADIIIKLDSKNPQVSARLSGSFRSWRALESGRRSLAEAELRRILDTEGLSRDTFEIVTKSLQ